MIKAILFDCDGVLTDTEILAMSVFNELMKSRGIRLKKTELLDFVGITDVVYIKGLIKKKKLPINEKNRLLKDFRQLYLLRLRNNVRPLPGVLKSIKRLKNKFLLGIVSGSLKEQVNLILNKLDIIDSFDVIITQEDFEKSKPNPEPYKIAARVLGVKPKECLAVEDSEAGILAAKRAGMKVVGVKHMKISQNLKKADFIINNLNTLNECIEHNEITKNYSKIAEFYNIIFQLQNQNANTKKECDFLEDIFVKFDIRPKSILDLGCGNGRMTCELYKRKYSVTGIDSSPEIIELAKKNCQKTHFIESQMEKLPKRADAAIIWWTTYTYLNLEEMKELIKELQKKVNFVVFDSSNYPADKRPKYSIKKLKKNGILIEERRKWRMEGKKRLLEYKYSISEGKKRKEIKYTDTSYWYPLKELKELFQNKFDLVEVFGDYDVTIDYRENLSKRLISLWKNRKI